jgi:hypothetical protein
MSAENLYETGTTGESARQLTAQTYVETIPGHLRPNGAIALSRNTCASGASHASLFQT